MHVIPLWDAVAMLIEAARQAEAFTRRMLALAAEGSASSSELLEALELSGAIAAANSAFQATAAALIAGRGRHGDGGAQVLATAAGLTRREARSQIKTAETLAKAPALRDAVAAGRVPSANAKRLADAADKTSADDVASDAELVSKAHTMRPDDFAKEARRWVVARDGDDGASEHARLRARRRLRIWDGDDGMVRLYGEFDPVTGTRIANRLRADADRMQTQDRNDANDRGARRRGFDQCMADALEQLTAAVPSAGHAGKPFADICVVAHVDEATGKLIAELPDGTKLPGSVLEELACGAKLTGVIYDRRGRAIWRTQSARRATEAQRQLLIARDGGCFACDARPGICDVHHVRPVSQGGTTKLDNLVLACWSCHNKIHHFGWQVHGPPGRRTLRPPDPVHHGPARAPNHDRPHHTPEHHRPRARHPRSQPPATSPKISPTPDAKTEAAPTGHRSHPNRAGTTTGPSPPDSQNQLFAPA